MFLVTLVLQRPFGGPRHAYFTTRELYTSVASAISNLRCVLTLTEGYW